MQMGIVGSGKNSGAPWEQELKAMAKLNTIEMQKNLIAAFPGEEAAVIFFP